MLSRVGVDFSLQFSLLLRKLFLVLPSSLYCPLYPFHFLTALFLHRLHEVLMDLQKKQLDDLNSWLHKMEETISTEAEFGASLEDVKAQIETHKVCILDE